MQAQARIAWNLRRLRVERGVSQEALAADADVDRSYLGRLERKLENPTILLLERLATALNVDLTDLLVAPPKGAKPPRPLQAGRKVKRLPRTG
ncbi:helix-turn-helix transcriptional regulator [Terrarubrum flagellatum]|uniref:helix-turn-helix domain-containing protein n=1 Tax=Terrirubrum flagellatum TaxID=2895980 RepID=UPI003144FED3